MRKPMEKVMDKMVFSCEELTELIEKKKLFGTDIITNMRMKIHLMGCASCRDYLSESNLLDKMLARQIQLIFSENTDTSELKERIKTSIFGNV